MKFIRDDEYEAKLFGEALFDEKRVHKDAEIIIQYENGYGSKLKAYCPISGTYLQFPRALREHHGQKYMADVVEVIREDGVRTYYRAMKKSIRRKGSDEVVT